MDPTFLSANQLFQNRRGPPDYRTPQKHIIIPFQKYFSGLKILKTRITGNKSGVSVPTLRPPTESLRVIGDGGDTRLLNRVQKDKINNKKN